MMNPISQQIALLRKSCGLTQEELAEKIGVSPQSISKWENGINMPDILLLPILAEIFEVSIDALFSRSPLPTVFPLEQHESFPLAAHEALLTLFQRKSMDEPCSQEQAEAVMKKMQEYLSEDPKCQCIFHEKHAGQSVYASSRLDLVLTLSSEETAELLKDSGASCILSMLNCEAFSPVLSYMIGHPQCSLTAAAAAAKCSLSIDSVREGLESMERFSLVRRQKVDLGEETIDVFSPCDTFKLTLLYGIFALSKRLFEYRETYYTAQKN